MGGWSGTDPASDVVELCRQLIRIDTSNYGDSSGPGERVAAEFVAAQLAECGIASRMFEQIAGRTSVVARWGDGDLPPLLIHAHLDVVPAGEGAWSTPPFGGELRDGCVWGRGAVDMKNFIAMLLSVIRARTLDGRPPARPVVLAFVADEETDGTLGAGFLVDEHPELFDGCVAAIGEVGGFTTHVRGRRLYLVETAEKGHNWFRVSAEGRQGHGSMISDENAVARVAGAAARLAAQEWPVRTSGPAARLLRTIAEMAGVDPAQASVDELLDELGPARRMIGAGMRNVSNPTVLSGGQKVNIVPASAHAFVDGRSLPGEEAAFWRAVGELVGADCTVDRVTDLPGWESPYGVDVTDAMERAILRHDPEARIAPFTLSAGTDAKHFRRLGIPCYGFVPLQVGPDLDYTALFHGVDERVPVAALEFGARVLDTFLDEF